MVFWPICHYHYVCCIRHPVDVDHHPSSSTSSVVACSSINNGRSSPVICCKFKDAIISSCRPRAAAAVRCDAVCIAISCINSVEAAISCGNCRPATARSMRSHPGRITRRSTALAIRLSVARLGRPGGLSWSVRAHHITEEIITGGHLLYARHAVSVDCHRCQLFRVLINRKIINTLDGAGAFFQAPSGRDADIFPNERRIIYPPTPTFHLTASERSTTPAGDGDGSDWRWKRFAECLRLRSASVVAAAPSPVD